MKEETEDEKGDDTCQWHHSKAVHSIMCDLKGLLPP